MPLTAQKKVTYISLALFVISLACPCYDTGNEAGGWGQGATLLIMGITWFVYPIPYGIWLANPALLFSWKYISKKPVRSFILSIAATLLALGFLLCKELRLDESGSNFTPVTEHRVGYWLWLMSMFTMAFGNLYMELVSKKGTQLTAL
jgi:hypothetical protein